MFDNDCTQISFHGSLTFFHQGTRAPKNQVFSLIQLGSWHLVTELRQHVLSSFVMSFLKGFRRHGQPLVHITGRSRALGKPFGHPRPKDTVFPRACPLNPWLQLIVRDNGNTTNKILASRDV